MQANQSRYAAKFGAQPMYVISWFCCREQDEGVDETETGPAISVSLRKTARSTGNGGFSFLVARRGSDPWKRAFPTGRKHG